MSLKKTITVVSIVAALSTVIFQVPHLWHNIYCELVLPLTEWSPEGVEKLLDCSNIPQTRLDAYNISEVKDEGYSDWVVLSAANEKYPATQTVELEAFRDKVIFFPRTRDTRDSISIYQVVGDKRRLLFHVKGKDGWSNIGKQDTLMLGCAVDGDYRKPFRIVLEAKLNGKTAQLWTLGGKKIFF